MAEILHFEILRKHGQTNTQTHKQTHKQTDMGITIPRPPPMGGEVNIKRQVKLFDCVLFLEKYRKTSHMILKVSYSLKISKYESDDLNAS